MSVLVEFPEVLLDECDKETSSACLVDIDSIVEVSGYGPNRTIIRLARIGSDCHVALPCSEVIERLNKARNKTRFIKVKGRDKVNFITLAVDDISGFVHSEPGSDFLTEIWLKSLARTGRYVSSNSTVEEIEKLLGLS
jgi:hypothetical protein